MPVVSIQQLLLAGTHFGHLTRRWNPKMKKYIFGANHGIHIIDLKKTQSCIDHACAAAQNIVKNGEKVLYIGTKKQAKDIIRHEASRAKMPYVSERWLGGMLTNFATIRKSIKTMTTYEKMATDGTFEKISKKERLTIEKAKAKLEKALGGIRDLKKLPGAVFIVDTKKEHIAISEARKLNIPVIAIVDTNVDPDLVDFPIPANDDAFKSIGLITRALTDAVEEAAAVFAEHRPVETEVVPGRPERRDDRDQARRCRPRHRPPRGGRQDGERIHPQESGSRSGPPVQIPDDVTPPEPEKSPTTT